MRIIHHGRRPLPAHFSIERLFSVIRRHLPADCEVVVCNAPELSRGVLPRLRNVRYAGRQQADVHHIVGDSHYLALGLPGAKTILTIHDCAALNRLAGWKRRLLKYFWFTGPMRRVAVVTTISEATKRELHQWMGVLADKVEIIPNCVSDEFSYDPKPFNISSPTALQVGAKWNKNLERVMEVLRGTGCRLEVVGGGVEGERLKDQKTKRLKVEKAQWLEDTKRRKGEKTKGLKDGGMVRMLGRLEGNELVEAYRRCDFVIFASLYEGFGLPILEAQATGRPVITSNLAPMTEVAGDGALFVDPCSAESIREAVMRVKGDAGLREELVKKGLRNVERFRPEEVAGRYARIYERLKD